MLAEAPAIARQITASAVNAPFLNQLVLERAKSISPIDGKSGLSEARITTGYWNAIRQGIGPVHCLDWV
jgi:hypothetical protein